MPMVLCKMELKSFTRLIKEIPLTSLNINGHPQGTEPVAYAVP